MKKILSLLILTFTFAASLFAYNYEEVSTIINNSAGWFYNPKTFTLEYIYMNGSAYCYKFSYYDVATKKIDRSGGYGSSMISYKGYDLNHFMKNFVVENGKITQFKDYDGLYYPTNTKLDEDLLVFLEKAAYKRFDVCLGTYTEPKSGRKYKITRSGEKYELTISYPKEGLPELKDTLVISEKNKLVGAKSNITLEDDYFRIFDPQINKALVSQNDGDEFYPKFTYGSGSKNEAAKSSVSKLEILTTLKSKDYTYNYDGHLMELCYSPTKSEVVIKTYDEKTKEWTSENFSVFKLYIDENGWKHIKAGEFDYLILDGNRQFGIFAYKGDNITKDAVAMKDQFSSETNNGDDFVNPKASSTLKEKTTEYKAQGAFNTFITNGYLSALLWNPKNIPWVEGKTDNGIGEYIEVDLTNKPALNRIKSINLNILGGYVDPQKPYLFMQNNRIKKLLVETDTGFSQLVDFEDVAEFTEISLPAKTKHIKLTIKEVYKGTKYSDTCISAVDIEYEWKN